MSLIIPKDYKQTLTPETTEQAIQMLKTSFQEKLSKALNLRRVTAPLFVLSGTGINDDLNGWNVPSASPSTAWANGGQKSSTRSPNGNG